MIIPFLEAIMNAYKTNQDLPASIRDRLPEAAQDFYRIAFNSAIQWCGDQQKAHQAALSAVRNQTVSLNSGIWKKA
jgi:cation transport regulator